MAESANNKMNPIWIKPLGILFVCLFLTAIGYYFGAMAKQKELGKMTDKYQNCLNSAKQAEKDAIQRAQAAQKALSEARVSRPRVNAVITHIRAANGDNKCLAAQELIISTLKAER